MTPSENERMAVAAISARGSHGGGVSFVSFVLPTVSLAGDAHTRVKMSKTANKDISSPKVTEDRQE